MLRLFVLLLVCAPAVFASTESTTSHGNTTTTHESCGESGVNAPHETKRVGLCLLLVIAVIFILEFSLRRAESTLKDFHTSFDLIQCLYRELMILGLVSMLVLIVKEVAGDALSTRWLLAFEFTHLFVFFIALMFVFQVAIVFVLTHQYQRSWQVITTIPARHFLETLVLNSKKPLNIFIKKVFFLDPLVFPLVVRASTTEFMRTHNLPLDFSFSKYLRIQISRMIIECVDPTIYVYCGMLTSLFVWAGAYSGFGMQGVYVCFAVMLLAVLGSHWTTLRVCGLLFQRHPDAKRLGDLIIQHDHTRGRETATLIETKNKKEEIGKNIKNKNRHNSPVPTEKETHFPLTEHHKLSEFRTVRMVLTVARFLTSLMMALNAYFFGLLITVNHRWYPGSAIPTFIIVLFCVFVVIPHSIAVCAFLHSVVNPDDEIILKVLEYTEELNELRAEILNKLTNSSDLSLYLCQPDNLAKLLTSFDKNGDGTVTIGEFVSGLRLRGVSMSARKVDRLVRVMDCDGSGSIEVHELQVMVATEANRRLEERIQLAFNEVSGKQHAAQLPMSSLQKLLSVVDREYCSIEEVAKTLALDENGDIPIVSFIGWYRNSYRNHLARLPTLPRMVEGTLMSARKEKEEEEGDGDGDGDGGDGDGGEE